MIKTNPELYKEALAGLRAKLKPKRGYASRIAKKLNVTNRDVYNVAWGRKQDDAILKALLAESRSAKTAAEKSQELMAKFIKAAA